MRIPNYWRISNIQFISLWYVYGFQMIIWKVCGILTHCVSLTQGSEILMPYFVWHHLWLMYELRIHINKSAILCLQIRMMKVQNIKEFNCSYCTPFWIPDARFCEFVEVCEQLVTSSFHLFTSPMQSYGIHLLCTITGVVYFSVCLFLYFSK